jgi:hypothetical protein
VSGLLIDGELVPVPGATVLSPGDEPWVKLALNDFGKRPTAWVRQIIAHTTQGKWPQLIRPGSPPAPGDRAEQIARYWSTNGTPGGAPLIVDGKTIACLIDLVRFQGYHATTCNPWSIGIEMVQEPDGTIYSDTIDTTVALILVLCDRLGIPCWIHGKPYKTNTIIERLKDGGQNVVGIFGHNQMAWMFPAWLPAEKRAAYPNGYADRGRGDPGDEIGVRLRKAGAVAFDYDARGELDFARCVQRLLNERYGERLTEDGLWGPGTTAAARRAGIWNGGLLGGLLAELP